MAASKKKPASVAALKRRVAALQAELDSLRERHAELDAIHAGTVDKLAQSERTADAAGVDQERWQKAAERWRGIVSKVLDVFYPFDTYIRSFGRDKLEDALPETVRTLSEDAAALRNATRDLRAFRERAENALRRARALIDDGDHRVKVEMIAELDAVLQPGATL